MKNTLFVMTHLGADLDFLKRVLESNKHVEVYQTGIEYKHIKNLDALWSMSHRRDTAAAWRVDLILHNKDFSSKHLARDFDFLYYVADPSCLKKIPLANMEIASNYYRYRLRGMNEWHKRTGGKWIVESDVKKNGLFVDIRSRSNKRILYEFKIQMEDTEADTKNVTRDSFFDLAVSAFSFYSV